MLLHWTCQVRTINHCISPDSFQAGMRSMLLAHACLQLGIRQRTGVYVLPTTGKPSATAIAGAKRLVPEEWRKWPLFDNIFKLTGVPVITVQLRYNGWVTELQDPSKIRNLSKVPALLPLNVPLYGYRVQFGIVCVPSCITTNCLTHHLCASVGRPGIG